MSAKKQIIEIESDGVSKEELFTFPPIRCPQCGGYGFFVEEIGRDNMKETPCPYCDGMGSVACTVFAWWRPYRGEKSIINNLKQLYDEVGKRDDC